MNLLSRVLSVALIFNVITSFSLHETTFTNPPDQNGERRIIIVTAGYNNKDWYRGNLDSVFCQEYQNYHLVYTDDGSIDGTPSLVEEYIKEKGFESKVTLIKNAQRIGCPLANQYRTIHACDDTDIIVILDADDRLAHSKVLQQVNRNYADYRVWLTYGQFIEHPSGVRGFCKDYPKQVIRHNSFREIGDIPSHMRTFYAGLFKQIRTEDLMLDGEFLKMSGDMAAMLPMIEMARNHYKFVSEILYIYNGANSLSEHRISKDLQRKVDLLVRSRARYDEVQSPVRDVQ
jgi:glycosyltransferase involved in cell wall biosynthesis